MKRIVTIGDIERLSKESARTLYGSAAVDQPDAPERCESVGQTGSQTNSVSTEATAASADERDRTNLQLETALRIITAQNASDIPFLFRSEAAAIAGVKGAATLQAAEKEALRSNIINRHEIAKAKTKIILWEITERGYELMKVARPKWKSKGEYRHKFCVHRIAHTFSQRGYDPAIEYRRQNGKLVDLRLSRDGETLCVEVCASFPVEKELINVEKNLDGSPTPTAMYLAVTDRRMKGPLKDALQEYARGFSLTCPVDVILAGDLIGPLEV
jgi:hypothetical protein